MNYFGSMRGAMKNVGVYRGGCNFETFQLVPPVAIVDSPPSKSCADHVFIQNKSNLWKIYLVHVVQPEYCVLSVRNANQKCALKSFAEYYVVCLYEG